MSTAYIKQKKLSQTCTYVVGSVTPAGVLDSYKTLQPSELVSFERRWVHVGAAFFDARLLSLDTLKSLSPPIYEGWRYIDADYKDGVKEVPLTEIVDEAAGKYCLEFFRLEDLDIKKLRSFVGTPFGKAKLATMALGGNPAESLDLGVTCAELIALCSEKLHWIKAKKPATFTCVHIQVFLGFYKSPSLTLYEEVLR